MPGGTAVLPSGILRYGKISGLAEATCNLHLRTVAGRLPVTDR